MLHCKFCMALLLLCLFGCVSEGGNRDFYFIQISDPQFGFFGDTGDVFRETGLYEKAVTAVNDLKPAFVVITGDFVNDRSDQSQWNEFLRITALVSSKVPVYLTPGNHDIGQNPSAEDIKAYKERFGDDRFSFSHRDVTFIGFNSGLIKSDNEMLEEEQFRWLTDELEKAKEASALYIFCHHPFFINSPDELESYSNIGPDKRLRYLDLFVEYGVDAIFAGHYHDNGYGRYDGIEMITTSAAGKPLGTAPSGMRIVRISETGTKTLYVGFDSIPDKINPIQFY